MTDPSSSTMDDSSSRPRHAGSFSSWSRNNTADTPHLRNSRNPARESISSDADARYAAPQTECTNAEKSPGGGGSVEGMNPQDATETATSTPLPNSSSKSKAMKLTLTDDEVRGKTNKSKSKLRRLQGEKKQKEKLKQKDKQNPSIRKRKRGRIVRLATVNEPSHFSLGEKDTRLSRSSVLPPPLPLNQYEVVLRRRAIRTVEKQLSLTQTQISQRDNFKDEHHKNGKDNENSNEISDSDKHDSHQYDELYGDTTLGMKLGVYGGKFIVRSLNNLSDGRASPAQLVGVINRGDVLLSINNQSVVNLPIDQLMTGLKPLSTPDPKTGSYQRFLKLRFAAGEGLQLLKKMEEEENLQLQNAQEQIQIPVDPTTELFSLFPMMVDQHSGKPMFEDQFIKHAVNKQQEDQQNNQAGQVNKNQQKMTEENLSNLQSKTFDHMIDNLNYHISQTLANVRKQDRERFVSHFFTWNNKYYSQLLRPQLPQITTTTETEIDTEIEKTMTCPTRSEMLDLGRRAIIGAMSLGLKLENLEQVNDVRSFRSWNSSLSLRSGAGSRRRYVMEVASLPAHLERVASNNDQDDNESATNTEGDSNIDAAGADGDELLLRLAAHDEIWRKQVLDSLRKAIKALHDDDDEESETCTAQPAVPSDIDTALSEGLGNFLFGEAVSKIVTEKKKSKALPPEEITSVLFDLSTNLAFTMPDEVTVAGETLTAGLRSTLLPFTGRKQADTRAELLLATRFILDEALPLWLKSFLPLRWEQRRVLWPPIPQNNIHEGNSTTMSSRYHGAWDDNLTVGSLTVGSSIIPNISSGGTGKRNKNLREIIEDQELNVETRGETCFLVSYYFERYLVPKLVEEHGFAQLNREELVKFVKDYGSYLKMDTCLAYSAMMECDDAISVLLDVAEYDPRHIAAMKRLTGTNTLVLYDSTMLSAVMKCLRRIQNAPSADHRLTIIHACVNAYPDLRPWQVRKECLLESNVGSANSDTMFMGSSKEELRELYYSYLSLLLHPSDGHEAARRDGRLVEEWCVLSLQQQYAHSGAQEKEGDRLSSRRKNFFSVASRYSNDYLVYHRDLIMLIELSMSSGEFAIALDLAFEILDHAEHSKNEEVHSFLLKSLRTIARSALREDWLQQKNEAVRTLKKIIRLLGKLAITQKKCAPNSSQIVSAGDELYSLLLYKHNVCSPNDEGSHTDSHMLELINFFAEEAVPSDFLNALNSWTENHELRSSDTVALLQTTLQRGTQITMTNEPSGSLFFLKRARQEDFSQNTTDYSSSSHRGDNQRMAHQTTDNTIWENMSSGVLTIEK